MKWNEYNAAASASNESARADSHHRAGPEPPETENKKPNRTRNNKITVYLSNAELSRLNAMVDKTIMNREQFIRKMIEGKTITEAPPALLLQTVRMMKDVLNELIDHIDVYETQGTGKNKTQRLVIYYKFVGYLDIDPTQCHPELQCRHPRGRRH